VLNADYLFLVEFNDDIAITQSGLFSRTVRLDTSNNCTTITLLVDLNSDPTGVLSSGSNRRREYDYHQYNRFHRSSLASGPPSSFSSVHRFAASLLLAGSPTHQSVVETTV